MYLGDVLLLNSSELMPQSYRYMINSLSYNWKLQQTSNCMLGIRTLVVTGTNLCTTPLSHLTVECWWPITPTLRPATSPATVGDDQGELVSCVFSSIRKHILNICSKMSAEREKREEGGCYEVKGGVSGIGRCGGGGAGGQRCGGGKQQSMSVLQIWRGLLKRLNPKESAAASATNSLSWGWLVFPQERRTNNYAGKFCMLHLIDVAGRKIPSFSPKKQCWNICHVRCQSCCLAQTKWCFGFSISHVSGSLKVAVGCMCVATITTISFPVTVFS